MKVECLKKERNSDEPKKPEQIVKLLRKADKELVKGKSVEDFCREEQISLATDYWWQRKYGGLQAEDARRLKALEVEKAKLKRLLAEAMLANDAIREFLEKKPDGRGAACDDRTHRR